jgi:TetR/AcrR family transcriptional repressor of nem operon
MRDPVGTRQRLVQATVRLILRQGYTATTVDQVCAEAGLTKGSFFHHFENKEAIGRAAVEWWSGMGMEQYAAAWRDPGKDPLEQLRAMLGIMEHFATRSEEPCVCVIGMMAQELSGTHAGMRQLCGDKLEVWTGQVARLLAAAKEVHRPGVAFDAEEVAWFLNSLWQGSMLVAKARSDPGVIVGSLRHARAYLDGLFGLAGDGRATLSGTVGGSPVSTSISTQ